MSVQPIFIVVATRRENWPLDIGKVLRSRHPKVKPHPAWPPGGDAKSREGREDIHDVYVDIHLEEVIAKMQFRVRHGDELDLV